MPDKPPVSSFPAAQPGDVRPAAGDSTGGASHRSHVHRGPEVRDTMAEMAERAQQIGQDAGTKIASAMRDVIGSAAGIAGFAVESVRDLVQFMVRRGQMTQDEADRLIREAEDARGKRAPKGEPKTSPAPAVKDSSIARAPAKAAKKSTAKPAAATAAAEKKPAAKKAPPAAKKRR